VTATVTAGGDSAAAGRGRCTAVGHRATATAAAVVTTVMTTTVATTASIRVATTVTCATAAAVAMTTVTGNGHLLTAQEGDADNREKNRDAQNQSAIHPKNLHKQVPERKVQNTKNSTV
jgi:hypothetical protein